MLDDDEVGPGQRDGAREGRLDVVGLDARVGEAHDVDIGPADALGDPGQGVEAGRHLDAAVVGGQRRAPGQGRDEEQDGQPTHENDSQRIENHCQTANAARLQSWGYLGVMSPKINVYLPDELATEVKAAGIPVSAVCQQALADAVAASQGVEVRGEDSLTRRAAGVVAAARESADGDPTTVDLVGRSSPRAGSR